MQTSIMPIFQLLCNFLSGVLLWKYRLTLPQNDIISVFVEVHSLRAKCEH